MSERSEVDADLIGRVPLTARRVLEIGRGDGALGAACRRRNPAIDWKILSPDQVETADDAAFDAIVVEDLGAFSDLPAALVRLHRSLAAGGVLVAGVAQAGHWTIVRALLGGTLPPPAIADAAVGTMLEAGGFKRVKLRVRRGPETDASAHWVKALADMAAGLGIDRAAAVDRLTWAWSTVIARKAEEQPGVPLTLVVNAMSPRFMDVRARLPAEQLQSLPNLTVSYLEKSGALPAMHIDQPKVAVMQRAMPGGEPGWVAFVARAIRDGWVIAAELDDHPDLIASVHGRDNSDLSWLPIIGSHAAQTSTAALAAAFRVRQPEVAAFPNAIFQLPAWRERTGEAPRIFYGALNRERFSRQVAAALGPVVAAHPDAQFTVVHDKAFFEALPTANKLFLPTLPYAAYLNAMAECHVALMPLEGVPAELYKSDVKWLEASAHGLATIASPAVYRDTIRDGETGLIAASPADFAPALARLLDDAGLRDRLARAAWEEVRDTRMFAHQVAARRDWYWSLWERRAALEAALRARVPALDAALKGA